MTCFPKFFFIFDVESIGLHGEGFAVAGGVYSSTGEMKAEFSMSCPRAEAMGPNDDRDWIDANVPALEITHADPKALRKAFWSLWLKYKAQYDDLVMAAECQWPVEARFIQSCIEDDFDQLKWAGPYPFHDIASIMAAAGMDPMVTRDREPSEMPAHNPLGDARQSARLLAKAIAQLES